MTLMDEKKYDEAKGLLLQEYQLLADFGFLHRPMIAFTARVDHSHGQILYKMRAM